MIDSSKSWIKEEMSRGASCIYSDQLGFDIYLDSNDKILHIEDIKRGTSITREKRLQEDMDRLNCLKEIIKENNLKWEK